MYYGRALLTFARENDPTILSTHATTIFTKIGILDYYHNIELDSDQPIVAAVPGPSYNIELKTLRQELKTTNQLQ